MVGAANHFSDLLRCEQALEHGFVSFLTPGGHLFTTIDSATLLDRVPSTRLDFFTSSVALYDCAASDLCRPRRN